MRTYMADVLLRDSDVMSMRHSSSSGFRSSTGPWSNGFGASRSRFKDDRRNPKSALAEATADILPPGLLKRRKRGFTLPFPIWMRKDLRPFLEDTFAAESVGRSGFLSPGPVRDLWTKFANGGEDREWSRVWSIAILIAFANRG
jgi:asparagine synthase (glutamine-hydrolysing)